MTNKKILIVEDDADVRLGYHVLLKANGYDTCFAADSITAISEARKHMPDLIILDLGSPRATFHRDGEVARPDQHGPRRDSRSRGFRTRPTRQQGTRIKGWGKGLHSEAMG